MQQVQDGLDFPIDTPSDEELRKMFSPERQKKIIVYSGDSRYTKQSLLTKNQAKRLRKKRAAA